MDKRFELHTHEMEDRHWWYRGRRRVLARVLASLEIAPASEILDAGCGSGRNMVELTRFGTVTGIEFSDESVVRARARGVGEVVAGSVEALPFAENAFDLAVSLDVIEHIDDDRRALRELRRVVREGGLLLITVPAYQWLWSSHDEINHHRRRYTQTTLHAAARDAGWAPLRTTYFNSLLLPAAIAHRGLERVRRREGPPSSDLDSTPGRLNSALEQPMRAEARLLGAGARIPAGLSLLTVFR